MGVDPLRIKTMFLAAANNILSHTDELTKLDSELGDGDHGITMGKLAKCILSEADTWDAETEMTEALGILYADLEDISGGSATPLFSAFVEGMADAADDDEDTDLFLKTILLGAYDGFYEMSGAEPGGKSMMDAIYPATQVIGAADTISQAVLDEAASAARAGSDKTVEMVGKYGRARYHGEKSIGHIDPGSVSFALFYEGLAKGYGA